MAVRLAALLPRVVAATAILLLATATYTFAAQGPLAPAPPPAPALSAPRELLVPALEGQAYVFVKGMLDEAGFAWRVVGPVQGFSANVVASQSPPAGTRVLDNGAPTIVLTLRRGRYPERGLPENESPFPGKPARRAGVTAPVTPTPAARPAPKTKPAAPAAKPKPAAVKPAPKPAAKPTTSRPPAFAVPGAPKEPLDEISLPERASRLGAWLAAHPSPTTRNVKHWLYQHAWIVTGAKFGWWRGADALELLIAADRRAQAQWGIGRRSELVARAALRQVLAKAR